MSFTIVILLDVQNGNTAGVGAFLGQCLLGHNSGGAPNITPDSFPFFNLNIILILVFNQMFEPILKSFT